MRHGKGSSVRVRSKAASAWLLASLLLVAGCGGGSDGDPGPAGDDGDPAVDSTRPLSSMVAIVLPRTTGFQSDPVLPLATLPFPEPQSIPDFVKALVSAQNGGTLPPAYEFPLSTATHDDVRTIQGLQHNVVVKWLDPLTWNDGNDQPRFGSNCDYLAYFGEGWDAVPGDPPQWNGSGAEGWVWSNFEYVSNSTPTTTSAPSGQALTLALWLRDRGILANDVTSNTWSQADVDTFIRREKREIGGAWFRVVQDPATSRWLVDREGPARRYDSTSHTLTRVVGATLSALQHDDSGAALPAQVAPGISGDCSGGQTPWGTIISAEENVQDYYGDLEACWSSNQAFVAGAGFDPGANVNPPIASETATSEFGRISDPDDRHDRDTLGYVVEIDPGVDPGEWYGETTPGVGHRKMGVLGRARWENATFVVDSDYRLVDGQPIVIYAADDRRGGRIFKWVSAAQFTTGMTKAQIRALLDSGSLYAAHFAGLSNATGRTMVATGVVPTEVAPGGGQWLRLSTTSTQVAPNAAELGAPGTTIGAALTNVTWNGIGGFPNDDTMLKALFTVCNKIGVMELNRPEDVEWNPEDPSGTPRLYVAFTNHTGRTALNQQGVLDNSTQRNDPRGAVWAIQEDLPATPAASTTFAYFEVWAGTDGSGPYDAANPDNIAIDSDGGVWFGTDGNYGRSKHADALYYLDLDPANAALPSYRRAFRVASAPSDAEATGPCFTSDERTLFFNAQHPGEGSSVQSTWPQAR